MTAIHKLMNVAFPLLSLILLSIFMPLYLFFKLVLIFAKKLAYSENMAKKVVIITGAASGIGEQVAYEYARRGAFLSLVDIKMDNLEAVANKARSLGSADVIIIGADVSKIQDCKRFVDETVNYYGQLDHLVNNAGIIHTHTRVEDCHDVSELIPVIDINFWGAVYGTFYAIPHLKNSKGKIIVIASAAGWFPIPRFSTYNASKAAMINFFETLRIELGWTIGITIVTLGPIKTDLALRAINDEVQRSLGRIIPMSQASECAKAIVKSACRGDMYVTYPSWVKVLFPWRVLFPEVMDLVIRFVFEFFPNNPGKKDVLHMRAVVTVFFSVAFFLNILLPPLTLALILFILLPYLLFKTFHFVIRSMLSQNVAGKVILITGASSGIGEHLAYEYGKRGARLALVARRENRLKEVATKAKSLGSPDVITIPADVSIVQDCKRFVDLTVNHFGQLDHLVNNAGIVPLSLFEHITDVTNFVPAMDINFWGSAYGTYFAIPHLRKSNGRIVAITSSAGWLPAPRMMFYNSSKAATITFYESLRTELGKEIGITIVTPGLIESEMTQGKFLSKEGKMIVDQEMRDVQLSVMPIRSVIGAAKAIVNGACRGDSYFTEPGYIRTTFYWKVFCPEVLEIMNRWLLISGSSERGAISKKLLDLTGLKNYLYPESIRNPKLKPN
ncbi:hypothetical protein RIF29_06768 [Crotalaria pallida]|uniref:Uncharacterized protein n=1 Tax=Crotalaria pallida TaxID=3830 RepID=A0AAN9J4D2_CROPI